MSSSKIITPQTDIKDLAVKHWDKSIEPADQKSTENESADLWTGDAEEKQELVCKEEIEEVVFD